jgi:hypothetical protein
MLTRFNFTGRKYREPTPDGTDPGAVQATEADKLREQLSAAKKEADSLADALLASVPDRLKALIPEGLDAAARVRWFNKAKAAGAFDSVAVPGTDTGKPSITPKDVDLSTLSPIARMARGYSK